MLLRLTNIYIFKAFFLKAVYYKYLHVWSDINGLKASKGKRGYSFYTRLICCQEIQKITLEGCTFKMEDYKGNF